MFVVLVHDLQDSNECANSRFQLAMRHFVTPPCQRWCQPNTMTRKNAFSCIVEAKPILPDRREGTMAQAEYNGKFI